MIVDESLSRLEPLFTSRGIKLAYKVGSEGDYTDSSSENLDIAVFLDSAKSHAEFMALKVDLAAEMIHLLKNNSVDVAILDDAPTDYKQQVIRQGQVIFDPEDIHPDYYVSTYSNFA